ncbi:sulfur oxidation c-type cytochrome SoxA [Noviherbaspirillum sp. 1P10PC]|uniref:sulfur oxidation c-type cytochrome SoxA n=1 Tax=Noviherbaspirillum sp. 1P10PC TaxID=3132292 RepID=UPI0039A1A923
MRIVLFMLCALLSLAAAAQRMSGTAFMGPSTQAMQRDDSLNPAMLWVKEGETAWRRSDEGNGKSCASCHGDAESAMRGVAARYPAFDAQAGRPVNLGQRINQCRVRQQSAAALPAESDALLGLESYVALQSRGMPAAAPDDARLQPFLERGQARWQQRMGQLNLSCAQCHDQRWGQRLGSSIIPQAHATGYPIYRLEWQAMGSLQRRLRNCLSGVRAALYPAGSLELVELELYLAQRDRGMEMEAPAVRP